MGRGNFRGKCGAPHCKQWGVRRGLLPNYFGQSCSNHSSSIFVYWLCALDVVGSVWVTHTRLAAVSRRRWRHTTKPYSATRRPSTASISTFNIPWSTALTLHLQRTLSMRPKNLPLPASKTTTSKNPVFMNISNWTDLGGYSIKRIYTVSQKKRQWCSTL